MKQVQISDRLARWLVRSESKAVRALVKQYPQRPTPVIAPPEDASLEDEL